MKTLHSICPVTKTNTWRFPHGVTLAAFPQGGGTVTHEAHDGVGSISFPVRHTGDAFHVLSRGGFAADLPAHCRAW